MEKQTENTQKKKKKMAKKRAKKKEKKKKKTERIRVRFWTGLKTAATSKAGSRRANHPILTQGGSTRHPRLVIGGKFDGFSFVFSLMEFESVSHDLKV